mgnify:CR=1 FL=1
MREVRGGEGGDRSSWERRKQKTTECFRDKVELLTTEEGTGVRGYSDTRWEGIEGVRGTK